MLARLKVQPRRTWISATRSHIQPSKWPNEQLEKVHSAWAQQVGKGSQTEFKCEACRDSLASSETEASHLGLRSEFTKGR